MSQVTILFYAYATEQMIDFVRENFHLNAELSFCGALDDLDDGQVRAMAPSSGETGVPIELKDGTWVEVDTDLLDRRCGEVIEALREQSDNTIVMFCTAPWNHIAKFDNLVLPFRLVHGVATALVPTVGKLGVIQPYAETAEFEIEPWKALGVDIISRVASAESGVENLVAAAKALEAEGASVIVLDCLFFVEEHYQALRKAVKVPVILPMTLLAGVINPAYF